jgi:hypothetical protein
MAGQRASISSVSTRIDTPAADRAAADAESSIDDDSLYYDATRTNSIDLEIAAKQPSQHTDKSEEREKKGSGKIRAEQVDVLQLVGIENPLA